MPLGEGARRIGWPYDFPGLLRIIWCKMAGIISQAPKIGVSATVRAIPIGLAGFSLRVFINFWVVPSDEQMNTT